MAFDEVFSLFQLALRERVWLVVGPVTEAVELAEDVESLGFLDGEYAMHSRSRPC